MIQLFLFSGVYNVNYNFLSSWASSTSYRLNLTELSRKDCEPGYIKKYLNLFQSKSYEGDVRCP